MIQEEIHQFIDDFKYFTAILALYFNFPTSFQSVSMSAFWLRPTHPHQKRQHFGSAPTPNKHDDVILERSLNAELMSDS